MHSGYYVYIPTNQSRSLYVGITDDLARRISEHRKGDIPGFSRHYKIQELVCCKEGGEVHVGLRREKRAGAVSRGLG